MYSCVTYTHTRVIFLVRGSRARGRPSCDLGSIATWFYYKSSCLILQIARVNLEGWLLCNTVSIGMNIQST